MLRLSLLQETAYTDIAYKLGCTYDDVYDLFTWYDNKMWEREWKHSDYSDVAQLQCANKIITAMYLNHGLTVPEWNDFYKMYQETEKEFSRFYIRTYRHEPWVCFDSCTATFSKPFDTYEEALNALNYEALSDYEKERTTMQIVGYGEVLKQVDFHVEPKDIPLSLELNPLMSL